MEGEPFDRRLSRADMLRLAALAAGAGVVAGPAAAADAAVAHLTKESGRLQVMDWAGYGNDGGQAMFAAYVHKYPHNKPQFTHMANESDALAKIQAGAHPDLFRPYVGWVKYFAKSGLVQPWNPKLISNFKHLNPFMVKAGQYKGKQYGIPDDWGFDAILYRKDKVHPKARSWGLLFDERYKGKIAWFDDLEMITMAGLYLKAKNPWNQTTAELDRSVNFLKKKKHVARTDLGVRDRPLAGIRLGRRLDRLRVAERLGADEEEAPRRVHAPEGEADRVGRHVHAAEGHAAPPPRARVRQRLELEGVGAVAREQLRLRAREHRGAAVSRAQLLKALQLTNPKAVTLPNAYLDRDIPKPRGLRPPVGAGEGGLTVEAATSEPAVAASAPPPAPTHDPCAARAAGLLAGGLLPRTDRDRRRLQRRRPRPLPRPARLHDLRRGGTLFSQGRPTSICSRSPWRCR